MFKKRRGIHIPYNKQGYIYFTCMNYNDMPESIKIKIRSICFEVCKEHYEVLLKVLTDSNETIRSLALKYHISETQLYDYRRKFYEAWDDYN